MKNNIPAPQPNSMYLAYDDGKISDARLHYVCVIKVTPSWRMPLDLRLAWRKEKKCYHWLFANRTDYVVTAVRLDTGRFEYFFRLKSGKWFSIDPDDDDTGGSLLYMDKDD